MSPEHKTPPHRQLIRDRHAGHALARRRLGYDVSAYRAIHPALGTLADLDALLAAAHRRGLRVLLDPVPNHTSIEHPWFREQPERYVWADPAPDGGPPNNWLSLFGGGPAWTRDPASGRFYLQSRSGCSGRKDVRAAFDDILRFWLDRGVDGEPRAIEGSRRARAAARHGRMIRVPAGRRPGRGQDAKPPRADLIGPRSSARRCEPAFGLGELACDGQEKVDGRVRVEGPERHDWQGGNRWGELDEGDAIRSQGRDGG